MARILQKTNQDNKFYIISFIDTKDYFMKARILLATIVALLIFSARSEAAFVIRQTQIDRIVSTSGDVSTASTIISCQQTKTGITNEGGGEGEQKNRKHGPSKSGWEGIAALCFSLAGICFILPVFGSIAGIVLGAIGMKRGAKHRGMATAGMIIGVATIFIIAAVITLVVAYA